jgi:uncharacterized membrane protein YeaQ/YmgE (transglycosylase-associated protein family)
MFRVECCMIPSMTSPLPLRVLLFFVLYLLTPSVGAQSRDMESITATAAARDLRTIENRVAPVPVDVIKPRLEFSRAQLDSGTVRMKTASGTSVLSAANLDAAIKPNTLFIRRTGGQVEAAAAGDAQTWKLPIRFSYIRSDGTTFSFEPFIKVLQPLLFNKSEGAFKGVLGLGVVDEARPRARDTLSEPVSFTIGGAIETINPSEVTITHLSQPYKKVELSLRSPGEEVVVDIFATLDGAADSIVVPAIRPELNLEISPSERIDGFGLSTAVIQVSAIDGGIFAGEKITLKSSMGRLRDNSVVLDSTGTAETLIRSSFFGPAVVSARAYPFFPSSEKVYFAVPVVFVGVALFGAIGGALARARKQRGSFLRSIIFGFIGALLGGLGVNYLNLPVTIPAGEVFVLVVSFFTAYLGSVAFKSIVPGIDSGV